MPQRPKTPCHAPRPAHPAEAEAVMVEAALARTQEAGGQQQRARPR